MPKIKALLQSGLREGTERVRAQFCTSTQEGSSEEYGGDKIEAGAQRISNRAMQTVRNAGDAAKDEAVKRIKNRSVHIRRREETPADDMNFTDNSPNASEQLTLETLFEDTSERPSNTTPESSSTDRRPGRGRRPGNGSRPRVPASARTIRQPQRKCPWNPSRQDRLPKVLCRPQAAQPGVQMLLSQNRHGRICLLILFVFPLPIRRLPPSPLPPAFQQRVNRQGEWEERASKRWNVGL